MTRWDILSRIDIFAREHDIPVNNLKSKITRELAVKFSLAEEDTYLSEDAVESAFEKVMKEIDDAR